MDDMQCMVSAKCVLSYSYESYDFESDRMVSLGTIGPEMGDADRHTQSSHPETAFYILATLSIQFASSVYFSNCILMESLGVTERKLVAYLNMEISTCSGKVGSQNASQRPMELKHYYYYTIINLEVFLLLRPGSY